MSSRRRPRGDLAEFASRSSSTSFLQHDGPLAANGSRVDRGVAGLAGHPLDRHRVRVDQHDLGLPVPRHIRYGEDALTCPIPVLVGHGARAPGATVRGRGRGVLEVEPARAGPGLAAVGHHVAVDVIVSVYAWHGCIDAA